MNFKRRACFSSAHCDKSPTAVMDKLPKTDCRTKWMLNFASEQQQPPTCFPLSRAHNWEVREQLGFVSWRPHMLPSPLGITSLRRLRDANAYEHCLLSLVFGNELDQHLQRCSGTARAAASPPSSRELAGGRTRCRQPRCPQRCGSRDRHPGRTLRSLRGNVNQNHLTEVGGNMFLHDKE